MSLDELLSEVFCRENDMLIELKAQLRENGEVIHSRGPSPTVPGSVLITCELAGEFLGYATYKILVQYFRRYHQDLFSWSVKHMLRRRLIRCLRKRHRGGQISIVMVFRCRIAA